MAIMKMYQKLADALIFSKNMNLSYNTIETNITFQTKYVYK